jgi:hypothetical protein
MDAVQADDGRWEAVDGVMGGVGRRGEVDGTNERATGGPGTNEGARARGDQ